MFTLYSLFLQSHNRLLVELRHLTDILDTSTAILTVKRGHDIMQKRTLISIDDLFCSQGRKTED